MQLYYTVNERGLATEVAAAGKRGSYRNSPWKLLLGGVLCTSACAGSAFLLSSQVSDECKGRFSSSFLLNLGTQIHAEGKSLPFNKANRVTLNAPEETPEVDWKHYEYVIVGSGTAAQAALEVIRASDSNGNSLSLQQKRDEAYVLIVTENDRLPRPDIDEETILGHELRGVYDRWRRHITSHLNTMVDSRSDVVVVSDFSDVSLDVENKTITFMNSGTKVSYSKCLLAPPGRARSFYVLGSNAMEYSLNDHINNLYDANDFKILEASFAPLEEANNDATVTQRRKNFAVVGGGFLGTEVVAALSEINQKLPEEQRNNLTHIFFEPNALAEYFPPYLSTHITKKLGLQDVKTLSNSLVTGVKRSTSETSQYQFDIHNNFSNCPGGPVNDVRVQATLMRGDDRSKLDMNFDYIVLASTHIKPEVDLVQRSSLEIDATNGGIAVNGSLEAFDSVFVAGDAASFYSKSLGRRRVEVYDHAINSGLICGRNMSGQQKAPAIYNHLPAFVCSLPSLGITFECVGEINSKLKTVGVWLAKRDEETGKPVQGKTDFDRGLIYYLKDSAVVGVVCCNASECVEAARDIISQKNLIKDAAADQLRKKILLAPESWIYIKETHPFSSQEG
eukprot:CAMPEP_0184010672 /NCGR_PEP_ID=MMETSP0954-20121128/3362_1 /TAXON_ID=627963 /ORGANISM="Aplanochytrium sp, Strain PBS07" /LENGTH=619 /DNA_ID=CAMNT_0026290325 /DNA_START=173 /DNA_END=2032 /DNA_ORIENTATION=+